MARAMLALFGTPVAMSLCFGVIGLVFLVPFLFITAVFALPLFLLLRRLEMLDWWHALLAGAVCSLAGVHLYLGTGPRSGLGWPATYLALVALGCGGAILFWWTGVFRNDELPFVSRRPPWSMLLLIPLAFGGWSYREALAVESVHGCVVFVQPSPRPLLWANGHVGIRLPGGEIVHSRIARGDINSLGAVGDCAEVSRRRTVLLDDYVYGRYEKSDGCMQTCTEASPDRRPRD